ncbi:hypothetical protein Hanom_Chr10g00952051 [Helianthus anomalus]
MVVSSPLGQSSGDNHRKEDTKGNIEDNGPVPLVKRRSEFMSVGLDQEAEKVVDINEEEATSQLYFNGLNLANNVIGEEVRSMENPNVCHDDRRNDGNSKEGGKPMQERENMGVEHSIGSVRIHDTRVEREGGVLSGVKEPQIREGGSPLATVSELPIDNGPYFFKSLDQSLWPKRKSLKVRTRNKSASLVGRVSPNSFDRPKKRLRDDGVFNFDLNVRGDDIGTSEPLPDLGDLPTTTQSVELQLPEVNGEDTKV